MKKLMAMIGAVAMSFGLFAAAADNYSSTSFEVSDDGCSDGETFNLPMATGWSTTSEDPFALKAQDASALPYPAEGTKARRDALFSAGDINDKFLNLEIPSNTLTRAIGEGQIFIDQLVKFTEYDSDPELAEDAKFAVWMKDDNTDAVGLYASVGTGTAVRNVKIAGEYDPDAWYRLTVKVLGNVRQTGTQAGFLVYVNGEPVTVVEDDKDYLDDAVAGDLATDANGYYAQGRLFTSMDTESAAIASVGYMGYGAIDDLIISEEAPAFAQEGVKYTFTVQPPPGLQVVSVEVGEEPLAGPPYQVDPDTTVRITYEAEEGYKITSDTTYDDVTITEDGQEITDTDVEFGEVYAQLFREEMLFEEYVEDELYDVINSLEDGDQLSFVRGPLIEDPAGDTLYEFSADTTIDVTIDGDLTTWEINSASEGDWITDNVGAEVNFVKIYNFEDPYSSVALGADVTGELSVVWDEEPDAESALCIEEDITVSGVMTAANVLVDGSITLSGEGKVITKTDELAIDADEGEVEKLTDDPAEGWFTYRIARGGDYVAQIGDMKYETLADALEAAEDTDEIELLEDIELTSQMEIDRAITLNLNKNTISFADGDYDSAAILVTVSGATIKNGSVLSTAESPVFACFIDFSEASGTLEDLTVDTANFRWGVGGDLPGDGQWQTDYDTYTVTCRNVKVTGPTSLFQAEGVNLTLDADCAAIQSGTHAEEWRNCAIHAGFNAIVTIAGGEYTGTYAIYKMSSPAKIYVNGGKFTGDVYMHELEGYTGEDVLAITAGNFKGAPIGVKYLANEVAEGYERAWVAGDEDGYVKPGAMAIEYTITYNDYGEWAEGFEPVESYTVETETFALPVAANIEARAGAEFRNWTNELGEVVTEVTKSSTGDLVLYAAWEQAGTDPVTEIIGDKVEGFDELPSEEQKAAYDNVQNLYNKFEDVDLTEAWIASVYGDGAKVPAAKFAATTEEFVDISVKYGLPIMTAGVEVETAQAADGAFTFKLIDEGDPVSLAKANVGEMIEWSADLASFAVNTDEVAATVDEDGVTIKATFLKPNGETKGFMKLHIFADVK